MTDSNHGAIAIAKMHGAGNDFLVVDLSGREVADLPEFARWACDRRTGVGADGVIAIESEPAGEVRMRTINADGSEADMCGNGIRCAARYLWEAGRGDAIAFVTRAGIVRTAVRAAQPEVSIEVALALPHVEPLQRDWAARAYAVEAGNPNLVTFWEDADRVDLPALALRAQRDPRFASGTNVHVASMAGPTRLRMRSWERGVGVTQACGTGAVAVVAAAIAGEGARSPVEVSVPGGELKVSIEADGAVLTGPAVRVFDTQVAWPPAR